MTKKTQPDATSSTLFSASPPEYAAARSESSTSATSATELARAKTTLRAALNYYDDFPSPGIGFVDILPLFATPDLHNTLIHALELQVLAFTNNKRPDVIVGLDARGFLFGPSLALRLGAGFAPVRKRNKLPGPTVGACFVKEYGDDHFQMQVSAIKEGQSVLIVDDVIATGGSAKAAGQLVEKLGGRLIGYLFILEIVALKGRQKLDASNIVFFSDDFDK